MFKLQLEKVVVQIVEYYYIMQHFNSHGQNDARSLIFVVRRNGDWISSHSNKQCLAIVNNQLQAA